MIRAEVGVFGQGRPPQEQNKLGGVPGGSEGTRCVDAWKMSFPASRRCRKSRWMKSGRGGVIGDEVRKGAEFQLCRAQQMRRMSYFILRSPLAVIALTQTCSVFLLSFPAFKVDNVKSFIFMASSLEDTEYRRLSRPKGVWFCCLQWTGMCIFCLSSHFLHKFG